MSEEEGPYYYTCPLWYLGVVPSRNDAWRLKVYEYDQQKRLAKATRPNIGDWVVINAPNDKRWHLVRGMVTQVLRTRVRLEAMAGGGVVVPIKMLLHIYEPCLEVARCQDTAPDAGESSTGTTSGM